MRALEMAFLGKITASMTHEIKNTLAIILESAGLLADLLAFSQPGSFPYKEKFQKVLDTIQAQVHRGVNLATRLNQFAHSMDEPVSTVKLGDLLELVAALMNRLVRRRGLSLTSQVPPQELTLRTDYFRLPLVLCALLECLAENLEANGEIVLTSLSQEPPATVLLEMRGEPKPQWEERLQEKLASLEDFLHGLKAEPSLSAPPAPAGVLLRLSSQEGD